jgi:hypothetical protein
MKEQVLCAIDFSESSIQALRWANKLAAGTGASLAVQYSYRLIQQGDVPDVLSFKRKTEAESKVKFSEIEKTVFNGNGAQKSFITEIGFYSDNIENFIRKNPSTVVVLSEDLAESIYDHKGETLIDFLKGLHVPLLVVPNDGDPQSDPRILRRPSPIRS